MKGSCTRLKTMMIHQPAAKVDDAASGQNQHERDLEHRWQGGLPTYEQDSPGPQVI